jgi:hypothetical protein
VLIAAVSAGSRDRLDHVLGDHGLTRRVVVADGAALEALPLGTTGFAVLGLEHGFTAADLAVIAEQDIFGDRMSRPARKRAKADRFLTELTSFAENDFVVHVEHGVGRYQGLETLDVGGAPHDCLKIVYEGNDKLYIPVENIEVLSRYSAEDAPVQLDRLGGAQWQARKARVKQRLRDIGRMAAVQQLRRMLAHGPESQPLEWLIVGVVGAAASDSLADAVRFRDPDEPFGSAGLAAPLPSLSELVAWRKFEPGLDASGSNRRGALTTSFVAFCLERGPKDPRAAGLFELLRLDGRSLPEDAGARDAEIAARLGATRLDELEAAWQVARR